MQKRPKSRYGALRITLVYLVAGAAWILLSDKVLLWLFGPGHAYALLQTAKGWFYVLATAILLYCLIDRELKRNNLLAREKIVLGRELNHRIKNNLQLILSLVHLQLGKPDISVESSSLLSKVYSQLNSIALIHQRLLNRTVNGFVDLGQYIDELVADLCALFRFESRDIRILSTVQELNLPLDTITSLGMIVNELLTNSLRHAFSDSGTGEIRISSELQNGKLELIISDNGKGLPETGPDKDDHLGLMLVEALLTQLDAEYDFLKGQGPGTTVRIRMPL